MVDRFPVVLRGYDKEKVDAAFEVAQDSVNEAHRTLANMREQIAADDDRILQLQAQLQEERNKKSQGNTFASLGFSDGDLEKMLWKNAERFTGVRV